MTVSTTDLDAIQAALVAALESSGTDGGIGSVPFDDPYVVLSDSRVIRQVGLCIDAHFDADKLAAHLHASLIAPLEARIAELEAVDPLSPNWRDGFTTSEAENCFEARQRIAELEARIAELETVSLGARLLGLLRSEDGE